jgi:ubiquinone/menaquinone biosynthesis C-methylase UbiE
MDRMTNTPPATNTPGQTASPPGGAPAGLDLAARANQVYHDLQAKDFDAIHSARHHIEGRFWREEAAPRLARLGPGAGLDVCTGTGFVPRVLMDTLPANTRMRCVDLSPAALDRAAQLLGCGDRLTFAVASAHSLPVADGSVAWVTLNAALHHIPEPGRALREIDRALKPGGLFALGFEPNARFFSSTGPLLLERLISYSWWYLSPVRNLGRIRRKFRPDGPPDDTHDHLPAVNAVLLREGLIREPLSLDQLRGLVDCHAHHQADHEETRGFHVRELLREFFPGYAVEYVRYSDYGGEALKRHPWVRACFDGMMRVLFQEKGMLFSWIVRKPA